MLIRRALCILCLATGPAVLFAQSDNRVFFESLDRYFEKHVRKGRVDYSSAAADSAAARSIENQIRDFNLRDAGRIMRKAFYLNTYNFLVINSVALNFPVASPMAIAGLYDSIPFVVAGTPYTLNELHKKTVAEADNDLRVYFWLSHGTLGSASPEPEAPTPYNLESHLTEKTQDLFNDPLFLPVDHLNHEVAVPMVFRTIEADHSLSANGVLAFINTYRRRPIPGSYKVSYYTPNMALNETEATASARSQKASRQREAVLPAYTEDHIISEATNMLASPFQARTVAYLLTHRASYNNEWDRINYKYRHTTFNMSFQFWSKVSHRLNIGMQFLTRTLQLSGFDDSPYKAITFSNDSNTAFFLRHVMNSAKYLVVDRNYRIVAQSSFMVPVSKKIQVRFENNKQGDAAIAQWVNQVYFVKHYSKYFSLFAEINSVSRIGSQDASKVFNMRGSLMPEFSFWFSRDFRFYAFLDLNPQLNNGLFSNFYMREGAGLSLKPGKAFQLDLQYFYDAVGKRSGAVNSISLAGRFNL